MGNLELDRISLEARADLLAACTAPQLGLSLMVMICISRLAASNNGYSEGHVNSIDAFHDILYGVPVERETETLHRLAAAYLRVVRAEDKVTRDPQLARFVGRVKPPSLHLLVNDTYMDIYWYERLQKPILHDEAFRSLGRSLGYPLKLAPIGSDTRAICIKSERQD